MKVITEKKWSRLYDESVKGIGTELENGDMIFEAEEWGDYVKKVNDFGRKYDDYHIIGFRKTLSYIKEKISKYRLKHIKLGKIRYKGEWEQQNFRIEGMSNELYWQMDIILAGLIRDYLREYIKRSPIIGNCVFESSEEKLSGRNDAERYREWCKLVENISGEFDELIKCHRSENYNEEIYKKKVKNAFEDLAFIYSDLNW